MAWHPTWAESYSTVSPDPDRPTSCRIRVNALRYTLFGETVSPNYSLFGDTVIDVVYHLKSMDTVSLESVSPNYSLLVNTVSSNYSLFGDTVSELFIYSYFDFTWVLAIANIFANGHI